MTKNKAPPAQTSMFDAFAAAEFDAKTARMPDVIAPEDSRTREIRELRERREQRARDHDRGRR